jgi:rRNA processing protein Gar1
MTKTCPPAEANQGDLVAIHGHHVGERERLGEILEVLGAPDHVHFRVRWDDDRESIFYPSSDAIVRRQQRKRAVKKP